MIRPRARSVLGVVGAMVLTLPACERGPARGRAAPRRALYTENVRRFTRGLPLLNLVDKAKGY